jgi:integrase
MGPMQTKKDSAQLKTRRSGKHRGYSIKPRGDRLLIEIRSLKYGNWSELQPKGTLLSTANQIAQKQLARMRDAKHGLGNTILKEIRLAQLLAKALHQGNFSKLGNSDRVMVRAFLKYEPKICAKFLANITYKDIEAHINRRLKEDVVPYTITRMLSPIRTIYRYAASTELFGLAPGFAGTVPNPFDAQALKLTLPKDESGRERILKATDDLKVYQAIKKQCRQEWRKRRLTVLVNLALTTALRRRALSSLLWEDIDWDNKVIRIKKTYFNKKKPAPRMAPITSQLEKELRDFHKWLPESERQPYCKLFPNIHERAFMHKKFPETVEIFDHNGRSQEAYYSHKKLSSIPLLKKTIPNPAKYGAYVADGRDGSVFFGPECQGPGLWRPKKTKTGPTRWLDDVFNRIIRRTDLFEYELDDNGEHKLDKKGQPKKDWLTFHDLRHTALTRYWEKPYDLNSKETDYLQGIKAGKYKHPEAIEICNDIRVKIEIGDAAMRELRGLTPRDIVNCPNSLSLLKIAAHRTDFSNTAIGEVSTPEEYQEWYKDRQQQANEKQVKGVGAVDKQDLEITAPASSLSNPAKEPDSEYAHALSEIKERMDQLLERQDK